MLMTKWWRRVVHARKKSSECSEVVGLTMINLSCPLRSVGQSQSKLTTCYVAQKPKPNPPPRSLFSKAHSFLSQTDSLSNQ